MVRPLNWDEFVGDLNFVFKKPNRSINITFGCSGVCIKTLSLSMVLTVKKPRCRKNERMCVIVLPGANHIRSTGAWSCFNASHAQMNKIITRKLRLISEHQKSMISTAQKRRNRLGHYFSYLFVHLDSFIYSLAEKSDSIRNFNTATQQTLQSWVKQRSRQDFT